MTSTCNSVDMPPETELTAIQPCLENSSTADLALVVTAWPLCTSSVIGILSRGMRFRPPETASYYEHRAPPNPKATILSTYFFTLV